MKWTLGALLAVLAGSGALLAARAQDGFHPAKPGKEHELLKQFEGDWDTRCRFVADPNQPPLESAGSERARVGLGGLWLISDYKGEFAGAPFEGHWIAGYDALRKKYVGAWIDSMSGSLNIAEGTADVEGRVITWITESTCSGQSVKEKMVSEIKDGNTRRLTFTKLDKEGKEIPAGSIEFTRKK